MFDNSVLDCGFENEVQKREHVLRSLSLAPFFQPVKQRLTLFWNNSADRNVAEVGGEVVFELTLCNAQRARHDFTTVKVIEEIFGKLYEGVGHRTFRAPYLSYSLSLSMNLCFASSRLFDDA